MTSIVHHALVILLIGASLALPLSAAETDAELTALRKELMQAEIELEQSKRMLPPATKEALNDLQDFVRKRAQLARVTAIDVTPIAEIEKLPPLELHRLAISGRGEYGDVHLFLEFVAKTETRILNFENLRLTAAPNNEVRFSARLVHAFWSMDGPAEEPPVAPMGSAQQRMISSFRQRLARTKTTLTTLNELKERFRPLRFLDALGAFNRLAEDQPLALTEIRAGTAIVFEGMLVGAAARSALKKSLDEAGFRVERIEMPASEECEAFTVTAGLKPGPGTEQETSFLGLFDATAVAECRRQTSPALGSIEVRGAAGAAKANALTIRLREIDVADLFRVLHELTSEDFVIDHDVKGHVNVAIEDATLDQILAAIPSAGVTIGSGPLRRVRLDASGPAPPPGNETYEGDPISFSLKNVQLADVLCIFKNVTGLPIMLPNHFERRLSVFADEVKWDGLLETVVAASSLSYSLEKNRMFVGRETDDRKVMVDACEIRTPAQRWRLRPEKISVSDLKVSGVARKGDTWNAYAYTSGPSRLLLSLHGDMRFFDGHVKDVTSAGATFQREK